MIYVVNVQARNVMDQLLVQEAGCKSVCVSGCLHHHFSDTKGITAYEGLNCSPSSTCRKPLQPGNPKSGLVNIGNQTQTLTAITMDKVGHLDRQLNEQAYICPGLGDAGDRIFGTK